MLPKKLCVCILKNTHDRSLRKGTQWGYRASGAAGASGSCCASGASWAIGTTESQMAARNGIGSNKIAALILPNQFEPGGGQE